MSATELAARLGETDLVVLDVRWRLGEGSGHDEYLAGHIPGAVHVDLETELAGRPSAEAGRHPLPHIRAVQSAARRWGVTARSTIVVYDDWSSLAAARAWWLMRWAGHDDVWILDGGLPAWRDAWLALDTDDVQPQTGDVRLTGGHLPTVDYDEVRAGLHRPLIDARSAERFRGDDEPIDPIAGHIPGALSLPTTENLDESGHFLPKDELIERFRAAGLTSSWAPVVYCGSGITAAHEIAALAIAGIEATLYPGSWSQWSRHPGSPVATGHGEPAPRRRTGSD